MNSTKKRLDYIDVAKFLGLFAVSLSHIAGGDLEVTLIDSFNLSLFFVLTGYTLSRHPEDTFGSYLIRKTKGYVFTLFWMNVLIFLIQLFFKFGTGEESGVTLLYSLNEWVGFLGEYRRHALWFVACLYFCTLVLYPMMKYDFGKWYLKLVYLLFPLLLAFLYSRYIHVWMHWNLDNLPFGVFFVYLGYLFRHMKWKDKIILRNRFTALGFGSVSFALCLTISYLQAKNWNQKPSWYLGSFGIFPLTALEMTLGGFGVLFIAYSISLKPMAWLGRANLVTLAIQQELVMRLFRDYLFKGWWERINALENVNSFQRVLFGATGALTAALLGYLIYLALIYSPLAFTVNEKRHHLPLQEEKTA